MPLPVLCKGLGQTHAGSKRARRGVVREGEVKVDVVVLLLMMYYTQHTFTIKSRFSNIWMRWNEVVQPDIKTVMPAAHIPHRGHRMITAGISNSIYRWGTTLSAYLSSVLFDAIVS